jgi:hypothetical protein
MAHKHRPGFVIPVNNISKPIARLAGRIGLRWRLNALRNSYISYRTVLEKNLAAIALDAGTSPATIRSNYLNLVPQEDARAWWKIMPPKHGNIIDLAELKVPAVA